MESGQSCIISRYTLSSKLNHLQLEFFSTKQECHLAPVGHLEEEVPYSVPVAQHQSLSEVGVQDEVSEESEHFPDAGITETHELFTGM